MGGLLYLYYIIMIDYKDKGFPPPHVFREGPNLARALGKIGFCFEADCLLL